jgi:hypothetical protein
MKKTSAHGSKLLIRSEVLAVVSLLASSPDLPQRDKQQAVQRLQRLEDRAAVLDVLMKELERQQSASVYRILGELLVALGNLGKLHDPLWALICAPNVSDEAKDAANLALGHLGDQNDPNLYLDFLKDPQSLIHRETERMLEVSAENPEALIDFIDFICSLPLEEQCQLLTSLQEDYGTPSLMTLYVAAWEAQPPLEVQEVLLRNIKGLKNTVVARWLYDQLEAVQNQQVLFPAETYPEQHAVTVQKWLQRAIRPLKLAGLYQTASFAESLPWVLGLPPDIFPGYAQFCASEPEACFTTLPDGLGNQGFFMARRRQNGDLSMMSLAVNDTLGVLGGFGFFALTDADADRLLDRFHEKAVKIPAEPSYVLDKLLRAEALNRRQGGGIPYEVTAWKGFLAAWLDMTEPPTVFDFWALCTEWARPDWAAQTHLLFRHPDFATWFLDTDLGEAGASSAPALCNHPAPSPAGGHWDQAFREVLQSGQHEAWETLKAQWTAQFAPLFLSSPHCTLLANRLAECAFLFDQPETRTFRGLAATEALALREPEQQTLTSFLSEYLRRTLCETLRSCWLQPAPVLAATGPNGLTHPEPAEATFGKASGSPAPASSALSDAQRDQLEAWLNLEEAAQQNNDDISTAPDTLPAEI